MDAGNASMAGGAAAALRPDASAAGHGISRIAHRAGNDREALRLAVESRVDWIEIDVWYSFGRLVARHERGLWRLPLTYERWRVRLIRRRPLELSEIIRLTEGGPRLFIDFKGADPRLPRAIVDTLKRYGAEERAAVCGQLWPPLDAVRHAEPRIQIFHSLSTVEHTLAYRPRLAAEERLDGVSLAYWLVTPALVREYAARGLKVFAWTVNDAALASRLVDSGVHGIISDRLELLAGLP